ncbi:hypothetical protein PsorP6_009760 [Peronosclerospora sorghi]|uniref:Uncharacterized protein n=1 Tax=Peronosclerospora sorghi TaxID=230839 RepID=A0ACC0VY62_9STRA|nr:hypothetical protein PsorP6_009760 [Peronosclerospora sorghi]
MEGVLWTRESRSTLLRSWHKRYFVLSESNGTLYEYACDVPKRHLLSHARRATVETTFQSSRARPSHGLTLRREWNVRGAVITSLAFPRVGKPHAFQVTWKSAEIPSSSSSATSSSAGVVQLVLSARQADEMRDWMNALGSAAMKVSSCRRLGRAMTWPTREPETGVSLTSATEYVDVTVRQRAEMVHLSTVYDWIHESSVKTAQNVTVAGVHVPRGSLLVSANGRFVQTLSSRDRRALLLDSSGPFPVSLRFLRPPRKGGVLGTKLYAPQGKKAFPTYGKRKQKDWKDQVVELAGDLLTCHVKGKSPMTSGTKNSSSRRSSTTRTSPKKRILVLTRHSAVTPVDEVVSGRTLCFMVTVETHSMLFQARSEADRREWIEAVECAITIAQGVVLRGNGVLPHGSRSYAQDGVLLQSAMNMRHVEQALHGMDERDKRDDESIGLIMEARRTTTTHAANASVSEREVLDMLRMLQSSGRFIEALQLMQQYTSLRSKYWHVIFAWALDASSSCTRDEPQVLFSHLLETPLSPADALQVQKDIPRTAKWLAESAGAPTLAAADQSDRLARLEQVLHAFLSSCALDRVGTDVARCSGFYMQGMNGLAFILLEVFENDRVDAFRFLRGVVVDILPHVFGLGGAGRDHFDLFESLVQVGDVVQDVVRLHLPPFHAILHDAGLPVCLLAYKWFPTLFSDVTLTASHSQLRFETLLACWDVCLFLGLEGMVAVALALCSAAHEHVVALVPDEASTYSAEQVSAAIGRALADLTPKELVTHVCDVVAGCSHPVLLKLRNAHRRRLSATTSEERGTRMPMTVTDLDSGQVFRISMSGKMMVE